MKVNNVMTRHAESIPPDATLCEAAERMRSLDVGSLPVCDNDRLVGILTDRDITVRCVSDRHDPRTDRVRDAMTPKVFYCFEDQDITEVAEIMKDKQVRRLPVLDHDNRLCGIISLGDLAVTLGDERLVGEALECISVPTASKP